MNFGIPFDELYLSRMSWMTKLQQRWNVGSASQVMVILVVFACTGFTIVFLKRPVMAYLIGSASTPWYANVIYYVLILPIYNMFLLLYGFLFGQFKFFWEFEKKFFSRVSNLFSKNKNQQL